MKPRSSVVALRHAQIKQFQSDTIVTQQISPSSPSAEVGIRPLYFTNTQATPISFSRHLHKRRGGSTDCASLGSATTTVNLPARGTAIIEAFTRERIRPGLCVHSVAGRGNGLWLFRQTVDVRIRRRWCRYPAHRPPQHLIYDDTNFTTTSPWRT